MDPELREDVKVKYKSNNSQEKSTILNLYASDNAATKMYLKINKNKQIHNHRVMTSPSETKRPNIKNEWGNSDI